MLHTTNYWLNRGTGLKSTSRNVNTLKVNKVMGIASMRPPKSAQLKVTTEELYQPYKAFSLIFLSSCELLHNCGCCKILLWGKTNRGCKEDSQAKESAHFENVWNILCLKKCGETYFKRLCANAFWHIARMFLNLTGSSITISSQSIFQHLQSIVDACGWCSWKASWFLVTSPIFAPVSQNEMIQFFDPESREKSGFHAWMNSQFVFRPWTIDPIFFYESEFQKSGFRFSCIRNWFVFLHEDLNRLSCVRRNWGSDLTSLNLNIFSHLFQDWASLPEIACMKILRGPRSLIALFDTALENVQ